MAANTRTEEQILLDRVEIARRYLQGESQNQIAQAIGVSREQIRYDLKKIRQEWLESSIRDFDAAKAAELAKIDNLETVAWDAWFRSGGTHVILTEKSVAIRAADGSSCATTACPQKKASKGKKKRVDRDYDEDPREDPNDGILGINVESTEKTEQLVGDDRFLARVAWCIDRRCKIFGVDAPTKFAQTDALGQDVPADPWSVVDTVLDRIASRTRQEEETPQ